MPTTGEPFALAHLPAGSEKERVRSLIRAAAEERRLFWRATLVKTGTADSLAEGYRDYYGLPDLEVSYDTNLPGLDFIGGTSADLEATTPATDVVAAGEMAFLYALLDRGEILNYDSPAHSAYGPAMRAGIGEPGYWAADAIAAALLAVGPEPEECARLHGASWLNTMVKIVVPLLKPGLAAAWLLLFIIFVRELGMSILLYGQGTEVMSVVLFRLSAEPVTIGAFALVQSAILLAATAAFRRFAGTAEIAM